MTIQRVKELAKAYGYVTWTDDKVVPNLPHIVVTMWSVEEAYAFIDEVKKLKGRLLSKPWKEGRKWHVLVQKVGPLC